MSADPLAQVYDAQSKLKAASSSSSAIAAESASYEFLISSVKGSDPVKSLCADFIPEFLHHFPALAERALNAQLDLVEDEKVAIRSRAIRGLEQICKNSPIYVQRVADVLSQLLTAEDPHELHTVKQTFSAIFAMDARAAFSALFNQLRDPAVEANLREKGFEFLESQLVKHDKTIRSNDELQGAVVSGVESLMALDLPSRQFALFLRYLLKLKAFNTAADKAARLDTLISQHAKLAQAFDGSAARVSLFADSLRIARSHHKKHGVAVEPLLNFGFATLLPKISTLASEGQVSLMQALALAVSEGVDAKFARANLAGVWASVKANCHSKEEKTADEADLARFKLTEAGLFIVHQLSEADPLAPQNVLGVAQLTGQPSDAQSEAKRAETVEKLTALNTEVKAWADAAVEAAKALDTQIKELKKEDESRKALIEKKRALAGHKRIAASIAKLAAPICAKEPKFIKGLKGAQLSFGPKNQDDKKNQDKKQKGKDGKNKKEGKNASQKGQKKDKANGNAANNEKGNKKRKSGDQKGQQQQQQQQQQKGSKKKNQNQKQGQNQNQNQNQNRNRNQNQNQNQSQNSGQKRRRQDGNESGGQKRARAQSAGPRRNSLPMQQQQQQFALNPLMAMAQLQYQQQLARIQQQQAVLQQLAGFQQQQRPRTAGAQQGGRRRQRN